MDDRVEAFAKAFRKRAVSQAANVGILRPNVECETMTDEPTTSDAPLSIDLTREVLAELDCLPHAAMGLGTPAGTARPVKRLCIEKSGPMWMLYRLDAAGGFVGDTTHATRADALAQARREFGDAMQEPPA
jgi:hypothetical protein